MISAPILGRDLNLKVSALTGLGSDRSDNATPPSRTQHTAPSPTHTQPDPRLSQSRYHYLPFTLRFLSYVKTLWLTLVCDCVIALLNMYDEYCEFLDWEALINVYFEIEDKSMKVAQYAGWATVIPGIRGFYPIGADRPFNDSKATFPVLY